MLGLFGLVLPPAPLSLGLRIGEVAPEEYSYRCCLRGSGGERGRRRREKKKGGLLIATETEGTVVSSFQEEVKELLENIVVSLGVATFKCGRGKGKGKGSGTHLFNIFT